MTRLKKWIFKNSISISILVLFLYPFLSCTQNVKKTSKGYTFTMIKEGGNISVKAGQFLVINMIIRDHTDSVWYDTREQNMPMIFFVSKDSLQEKEGKIENILRTLSKGDSIFFDFSAQELFEKMWRQPMPHHMDSTTKFNFYIGVKDVMDSIQMATFREKMINQQNKIAEKNKQEQVTEDMAIIDAYLDENNIKTETTQSGLRYQILKEGQGEYIRPNQKISVHYAGYMMSGILFDTSIETVARNNDTYKEGRPYHPFTFTVGQRQVIQGWEEAVLLMKKGSKIKVWIPSTLAYGAQKRSKIIVENSILVFDMEVLEVN